MKMPLALTIALAGLLLSGCGEESVTEIPPWERATPEELERREATRRLVEAIPESSENSRTEKVEESQPPANPADYLRSYLDTLEPAKEGAGDKEFHPATRNEGSKTPAGLPRKVSVYPIPPQQKLREYQTELERLRKENVELSLRLEKAERELAELRRQAEQSVPNRP